MTSSRLWRPVFLLMAFPGTVSAAPPAPVTLDCRQGSASAATPTGTLQGTLACPEGGGPCPAVLIIAGSGPTDRDGNVARLPGHNDSLRMLAEGLQRKGIASVRYDKRGLGGSRDALGEEKDLRFDTLIEDAAFWLRGMRSDPRFGGLTVIGHSEGSLIGMVAARQAGADAFVSLEGAGRRAAELIREQLSQRAPGLLGEANRILAELSAGRTVADVSPSLAPIFRASVQPYLISWFRYDPRQELAKLAVPILVVQGMNDIQVSTSDATLLAGANRRATLALVPGMNHVLKEVSGDLSAQRASYSDPALPLASTLVETIARFVPRQRAQPPPRTP